MKAYKIRDKKTGQFTEGGRYAAGSFGERGKVWWSLKEVLAFLKYYLRDQQAYREEEKKYNRKVKLGPIFPPTWEIVEFEMQETSTKSVEDFLKESKK